MNMALDQLTQSKQDVTSDKTKSYGAEKEQDFSVLQERPDGDAGGGDLRREQEHRQPLLQPSAQGDPQRERPRGEEGGRRVRAGRVVLRREEGARKARPRGRRQDAGVRAAQARGQGVRDNRTRLLAGVPDANHPRANS